MVDEQDVGARPSRPNLRAQTAMRTPKPGQTVPISLQVQNPTARHEEYLIEVVGPLAAFAEVRVGHERGKTQLLTVEAHSEGSAEVILTLPPTAAVPGGTQPVGIRCTSREEPADRATEEIVLEVEPLIAVSIAVRPSRLTKRSKGKQTVTVTNASSSPAEVSLVAVEDGGARTSIDRGTFTVPARDTSSAVLTTRTPSLVWMGDPEVTTTTVSATAKPVGDDLAIMAVPPTIAMFTQRQVLPKLGFLLIPVALIVAGLLWYFSGGPEPDEAAAGLEQPDPPVVAMADDQTSAVIRWYPVPGADQYQIKQGSAALNAASVAVNEEKDQGDFLRYEASDLEPGFKYCWTVAAVASEAGEESEPSDKGCSETQAEADVPPPTNFQAVTGKASGEIVVSWADPGIDGAEVIVQINGRPEPPVSADQGPSTSRYTLDDTNPARVRIRLRLANGQESVWTEPIDVIPATTTTTSTTTTTTTAPPATTVPATPPGTGTS